MVLLTGTASAHTRTELDIWLEEWAAEADHSLTPTLYAELDAMQTRHPRWGVPLPAPRPTGTTFRGMGPGVERWRGLVAVYFAPELVDHALCVMDLESGGNPNALNPSSAAGLFQFLRSTWDNAPTSVTGGSYDSGRVYDPAANVAAAAWLQARSGWSPWTVAPRC